MKLGIVYPQVELGGDPQALRRVALGAEAMGYDHFLIYDHVVGCDPADRDPPLWGPYTHEHPFHDPLMSLSLLAGITQRIELATGILILPQRQTALVARQVADLDLFSNGRLRLGVGSGWNDVEYVAMGQDFHTRGAKMTEQLGHLRRLWSEPLVSYAGRFDRMERCAINPRPQRQIPLWCGGFGDAAFHRAAAFADGFIFAGGQDREFGGWTRMQEILARSGRSPAGFGADVLLQDDAAAGLPVERAVDVARRWRDVGGTHISVVSMGRGYRTVEEHLAYFGELRMRLSGL